jgi:hypothetical protein
MSNQSKVGHFERRVMRVTMARSASSGGSWAILGRYDATLLDPGDFIRAEFFDLTRNQVVTIADEWGAAIEGES